MSPVKIVPTDLLTVCTEDCTKQDVPSIYHLGLNEYKIWDISARVSKILRRENAAKKY